MQQILTGDGVSGTMYLGVYSRAFESRRAHAQLHDPTSESIAAQLQQEGMDFSHFYLQKRQRLLQVGRTILYDELVCAYLAQHPEACVLNLGCGLDTRFQRLSPSGSLWYHLDLPTAIVERERFLPGGACETNLPFPVCDPTWPELIDCAGRDILILAEGLSMYLYQTELVELFALLSGSFQKDLTLLIDLMPPPVLSLQLRTNPLLHYGALLGQTLAALSPDFDYVTSHSILPAIGRIAPAYLALSQLQLPRLFSDKVVVMHKDPESIWSWHHHDSDRGDKPWTDRFTRKGPLPA